MASRNCNFIQKQLFKISKIRLLDWGIIFEISRRQYARSTPRIIYQVKRWHGGDGRLGKLRFLNLLMSMPTRGLMKMRRRRRKRRKNNGNYASLLSILINCIRLVVMQRPFGSLVQQTITTHRRYVYCNEFISSSC